jgi:hypothetical protein
MENIVNIDYFEGEIFNYFRGICQKPSGNHRTFGNVMSF